MAVNINEETRPVFVYGMLCKPVKVDHNSIVRNIKHDLSYANEGDVIKIISGVADCKIYNLCEEYFRQYNKEKKLQYEMIAGPVISSCPENGTLRSAILDLAEEGLVDLYLSPVRRRLHTRIVGEKILRGEMPHHPLDAERWEYIIDLQDFMGKEKENAIFAIRNKVREFEALKIFCDYIPPNEVGRSVTFLPNYEIEAIDREARERRSSFDLLPANQILKLRQEI